MSGRRLVVRQALALMALGIALFATAATSATTYDQAGGTEGNVTLTAASPIVVRHLHIVVPTGGQKVTVTGRISVSLGPKRPEPITFEIVRDADGATLALSPLNESIAAIGRRFTPFEQCGPDDCEGDFTVTLRLIGGDVGTVGWSAGVAVHFPAPAGGDTIPTVVITE